MPFKSEDQRGYMWSKHPDIARRWEKITDDSTLPKHLGTVQTTEPASDNAAFDVHATDPARLKAEVKKDLGITCRRHRRSK